jgi:hypothetical protein
MGILFYLFGCYTRHGHMGGRPVRMRFFFRRNAYGYGWTGLTSMDPYARCLTGHMSFTPGVWARKEPRASVHEPWFGK